MCEVTVGIDVGTTSMKAAAYASDLSMLALASVETSWNRDEYGGASLPLDLLRRALVRLLQQVSAQLPTDARVTAIGIAGMAETGVLLDADGEGVWPAIAWHDPRGGAEAARLAESEPSFAADFSYRTGLPLDGQATFSKLLWLTGLGGAERGVTWLSIPEYLAWCLTGVAAAERSLISRTGLFDHTTGRPWLRAVELAGVDPEVVPPVRSAREGWGSIGSSAHVDLHAVAADLSGASVTVAGHDHIVASMAEGTHRAGDVFNSCGTADVVLRIVDRWPDPEAFARLAGLNVSLGNHPTPGLFVVNGGTKSGLVLRRLTSLLGSVPEDASPDGDRGGADLAMPGWGSDVVTVTLHGDAHPVQLWNSAFSALRRQSQSGMNAIETEFGPYSSVICGGGWTRLAAVRHLKTLTYRNVTFSSAHEPGCLGAALAALPTSTTTKDTVKEKAPHV